MKRTPWSEEDIDVLIDMLDDPRRCWFAAWELRRVLISKGEVTPIQTERIAELVGVPRLDDGYFRSAVEDELMDVWSESVPFNFDHAVCGYRATDKVEPLWQAGTYLFASEEEAEAYLDLRAWKKRVKAESKKA